MTVRVNDVKKSKGLAHWEVTWRVDGKKKRKYFRTKADASVFMAEEKAKLKTLGSHHSHSSDIITDWARLDKKAKDAGTTLEACVTGWLDHLGKVIRIVSLSEAVDLYIDTIGNLSTRRGKKSKLGKLLDAYPESTVDSVAEVIIVYMDRLRSQVSAKTLDNHKRDLSAFLSWCKKRDMIAKNRLLGIDDYNFTESRPVDYLTIVEVKKVLSYIVSDFDLPYASYIVLSLFSGIRPEELLKKVDGGWEHITWADVYHKQGVFVSAKMAKAMAKKKIKHRYITRNETLKVWLEWLQEKNGEPLSGKVLPVNFEFRHWRDKHEDLIKIMKNRRGTFMRHTFATYSFETTDSKASTARMLGNSETVLEQSYISGDDNLKAAAVAFWKLTPCAISKTTLMNIKDSA